MKISIELSGGLDICFGKQKSLEVEIAESEITIANLIKILNDNYVKDKPELFYADNELKPGILVLINDADWELEEKEQTLLHDKDVVSFISTLHGG